MDLDIKGNRKWKYQNISCISCKDETEAETQNNFLKCKKLNEDTLDTYKNIK